MSAVEDGGDFICNGHKIWTTHANRANWIFCLVRTSTEAIRQRGITFLLIDMATPGVEVRPIVSLSGEHIQNEVFFNDVRVPKANAVGPVGEGWTVAKYLLAFERGGGAYGPSAPYTTALPCTPVIKASSVGLPPDLRYTYWYDIDPRFSVAWRPFGNPASRLTRAARRSRSTNPRRSRERARRRPGRR